MGFKGSNDYSGWASNGWASNGWQGDEWVRAVLSDIDGLTFYKDFVGSQSLKATYAVGSPTGTFTATRSASAPATYVDGAGMVQLVTASDVPRYSGGYYDATGFRAGNQGVMMERASTNYLLDSNFGRAIASDAWDIDVIATAVDSTSEIFNIAGAKRRRIDYTYTGVEANYTSFLRHVTANDSFDASGGAIPITLSFWAKGDLSSLSAAEKNSMRAVQADANTNVGVYTETPFNITGTTLIALGLSTTTWKKFTASGTISNATSRKVNLYFFSIGTTDKPSAGKSVWLEIEGVQLEKLPYATSFIPTTTAVLTRGAEVLSYAAAGNRTTASETAIIKYAPSSTFAAGVARYVMDSTNAGARMSKGSAAAVLRYGINSTILFDSTTTPLANVAYVFAGVNIQPTGDPNAKIYVNGTLEATSTADGTADFGAAFYIGTAGGGLDNLDGTISSVSIIGREATAAEIARVCAIMP